jgi:hypothetical protein
MKNRFVKAAKRKWATNKFKDSFYNSAVMYSHESDLNKINSDEYFPTGSLKDDNK